MICNLLTSIGEGGIHQFWLFCQLGWFIRCGSLKSDAVRILYKKCAYFLKQAHPNLT